MKKGYWVVAYKSISDDLATKAYAELALSAVESFGGRFLTRSLSRVQPHEAGLLGAPLFGPVQNECQCARQICGAGPRRAAFPALASFDSGCFASSRAFLNIVPSRHPAGALSHSDPEPDGLADRCFAPGAAQYRSLCYSLAISPNPVPCTSVTTVCLILDLESGFRKGENCEGISMIVKHAMPYVPFLRPGEARLQHASIGLEIDDATRSFPTPD
jgi:hypothetical protein